MEILDNFKDKIDDDELAKLERELEDRILIGETINLSGKNEQSEHERQARALEALYAEGAIKVDWKSANEAHAQDYVYNFLADTDYRTGDLSRIVEDDGKVFIQNHMGEVSTSPLTDRINELRTKENDKVSAVEGITPGELESLKSEAHDAFAPRISKTPPIQVVEEDFNRTVALDPRKVGALALQEDIEKSSIDPNRGVRDFYNKVYSDHGDKRLREKEHYLNMAPTGDVSKARDRLKKYDSFNSLNAAAHDTINDGLISAMRDLHKEEREKNPKDEELAKRHLAEEKLFEYRETSEKLVGNNPQDAQREKDSFGAVMKAHTGYVEERWGRKLEPQKTPSVNDELAKMRNTAEPVVRPVAPTMSPKTGLKLKIGLHR